MELVLELFSELVLVLPRVVDLEGASGAASLAAHALPRATSVAGLTISPAIARLKL